MFRRMDRAQGAGRAGTAKPPGFWETWKRVRREEKEVRATEEGVLVSLLAAMHAVKRLMPLYLLIRRPLRRRLVRFAS